MDPKRFVCCTIMAVAILMAVGVLGTSVEVRALDASGGTLQVALNGMKFNRSLAKIWVVL